MARPKKYPDSIIVNITIGKRQWEQVKLMAIKMSSQERRVISASEAAVMAISKIYELPEVRQMDMFKPLKTTK